MYLEELVSEEVRVSMELVLHKILKLCGKNYIELSTKEEAIKF